ncbi:MAG: hypothetical protein ACK57J_18595 [Rubrivivax sp.]
MGHCFRANGYHTAYQGTWQLSALPPITGPCTGAAPTPATRWSLNGSSDDHAHGDFLGSTWSGHRHDPEPVNAAFGSLPPGGAAWSTHQNHCFNAIRVVDRHLVTLMDALDASG